MRTCKAAILALAILATAWCYGGEPPAKDHGRHHKVEPKPAPEPAPAPEPSKCGQCAGLGKTAVSPGLWSVCTGCLGAKVAPDLATNAAREAFLAKRADEVALLEAYASALSVQSAYDQALGARARDGHPIVLPSVTRKRDAAAAAWANLRAMEAKAGHPAVTADAAADAATAKK